MSVMTDDRLLLRRASLVLALAESYLTEIASLGQAYPRRASIGPFWHVLALEVLPGLRRLLAEIEASGGAS